MESTYFTILPEEIIFEIFHYVNYEDVRSFQDTLYLLDIQLNYFKLFLQDFPEEYLYLRKVISHDKKLKRYLNWDTIYPDFHYINHVNKGKTRISGFTRINEEEFIWVDHSTLSLVYQAHIHCKYQEKYYILNYFDAANLRSYITPWILYQVIEHINMAYEDWDQLKPLFDLNSDDFYNSVGAGRISIEDMIIVAFMFSFEREKYMDILTRKFIKELLELYREELKGRHFRDQDTYMENYYSDIILYLEKKVER